MIKILKEGKLPNKNIKRIYKTTCSNCSCEFEFEKEDCIAVERRLDGNMTVECPYCHTKITQAFFKYREVLENV